MPTSTWLPQLRCDQAQDRPHNVAASQDVGDRGPAFSAAPSGGWVKACAPAVRLCKSCEPATDDLAVVAAAVGAALLRIEAAVHEQLGDESDVESDEEAAAVEAMPVTARPLVRVPLAKAPRSETLLGSGRWRRPANCCKVLLMAGFWQEKRQLRVKSDCRGVVPIQGASSCMHA